MFDVVAAVGKDRTMARLNKRRNWCAAANNWKGAATYVRPRTRTSR